MQLTPSVLLLMKDKTKKSYWGKFVYIPKTRLLRRNIKMAKS